MGAHAKKRCDKEGWYGVRFHDGQMRVVRLRPAELNLYDVATHVILPATHGYVVRPQMRALVGDEVAIVMASAHSHVRGRTSGGHAFSPLSPRST